MSYLKKKLMPRTMSKRFSQISRWLNREDILVLVRKGKIAKEKLRKYIPRGELERSLQ